MWWWQSVAFGGSLMLGALVPDDHFADCLSTPLAHPVAPRARHGIAFSNDRRSCFVMVYLPSVYSIQKAQAGIIYRPLLPSSITFEHLAAATVLLRVTKYPLWRQMPPSFQQTFPCLQELQ